jgi:hypothetical protein
MCCPEAQSTAPLVSTSVTNASAGADLLRTKFLLKQILATARVSVERQVSVSVEVNPVVFFVSDSLKLRGLHEVTKQNAQALTIIAAFEKKYRTKTPSKENSHLESILPIFERLNRQKYHSDNSNSAIFLTLALHETRKSSPNCTPQTALPAVRICCVGKMQPISTKKHSECVATPGCCPRNFMSSTQSYPNMQNSPHQPKLYLAMTCKDQNTDLARSSLFKILVEPATLSQTNGEGGTHASSIHPGQVSYEIVDTSPTKNRVPCAGHWLTTLRGSLMMRR